MSNSLAGATHPYLRPPVLDSTEYTVRVFYNGTWKETRLKTSLVQVKTTAKDVHHRTGFLVQVREGESKVVAQYGTVAD